jgi:hypothetical protein
MADTTTSTVDTNVNIDEQTRKFIVWFKEDIPHVLDWRKEAREDFLFYANDQWSEDDKKQLRLQGRPAMTFNRIAPLVNAVTGSEINNRREVRYIPREEGDSLPDEMLTSAGEWFRDIANAEDEESDAFADTVIGGMGWTDTRLDFESEPDGAPLVARLDPFKMVWSSGTKPNLEDSERMFFLDEKPLAEAEQMFPDANPEDLHADWATTLMLDPKTPHDQTRADHYEGGQNDLVDKYSRRTCTIVECRWLERVPFMRGPDIANPGKMREYHPKQVELIQQNIPGFKAVRQYKKVVKRAFIGRILLAPIDSPAVPDGLIGWECITGYQDKIKNQFYGVVRPTKDPQRWSNKYFSQVMYILNSKAKGGVMAERGSFFENDLEAQESWAKSDTITWLKSGALSGQSPKVQPKPEAQFPAGFWTLFEETKEAINQVTGLSPEFIGTREVDQAGVLEYQRKQSSLSLLAPLFNSLRRYRKRQGRIMLYLIQNYLADGRLVRIVGKDNEQYVPLMKEKIANIEYDIIVDDAPNSPNEKDRTWSILQSMLPLIQGLMPPGALSPDVVFQILQSSPLPASLVSNIKNAYMANMQQQAQQPPQPTHEDIKTQALAQQSQIKIQGQQADLQTKQQGAAVDQQSKAIDLYMEQQKAAVDQQNMQFQQSLDLQKMALQERQMTIAAQRAETLQTKAAK